MFTMIKKICIVVLVLAITICTIIIIMGCIVYTKKINHEATFYNVDMYLSKILK